MNLSFSTNAFKRNSFEEAICAIAAAGYGGVEFMADLHHAHPARMTAGRVAEVAKLVADLGLFVSNINGFTGFACGGPNVGAVGDTYHPTWIEADAALRRNRVEHTLRCVELAAAFGSTTVSLQPGGPVLGTGLSYAQAGERFAEGIAACAGYARACGVTLAVEPEPGLLIQTAGEYLAWKAAYFPGNAQVKMNCDCGHLFCVGDDPARIIREHPAEIAHVHLEDIGANRVHQHLTPGKGVMDFPAIFSVLKEVSYEGRVTVELYPYETTAEGVARAAMAHLAPMDR